MSARILFADNIEEGEMEIPERAMEKSGSMRMRRQMKKAESFRRADGTLGEKQPAWDKIKKKEDHRRKLLRSVEQPFFQILTHGRGTCLRNLILDPLIWITMSIFVGLRIYARQAEAAPIAAELLGKSDINILGGFLSFFLVFFVNQTNSRFLEMYGFSKASAGRTQDVAGIASTQFPPHLAQQINRHMNAAHIAGYVGLGGPYSKKHFFDHYNSEWNLMTEEEMESISHYKMDSGADMLKELVTWCQRDVGIAKKAGYIDSVEATELHDRIVQFRAAMDGIYDYTDQPPHFFYIHFLCLLSAFYLPLFAIDNAYSTGWGAETDYGVEVLNGIIVFLQCVFVIGLRLLGQKMVDPYGDDLEDLSVKTYVETTLINCNIILNTKGSMYNAD